MSALVLSETRLAEGEEVRDPTNAWRVGTVTSIDGGLGRCCVFVHWNDGSAHWHKTVDLAHVNGMRIS